MFYVFQFEDATWRIDRLTSGNLLPVAGEARRVYDAVYRDRAAAFAGLARLTALARET